MSENRSSGRADDRKATGEHAPRSAELRSPEQPSPQLTDPNRDQHGEQQKPTNDGDSATRHVSAPSGAQHEARVEDTEQVEHEKARRKQAET